MRNDFRAMIIGTVLLAVGCGSDATGPGALYVGEGTDQIGDGELDISSTRVRVLEDEVEFTVVFDAETFDAETSRAQFAIDIDEDQATGDSHSLSPDLGIEFLANIGTPYGNGVRLLQHDGTPNGYDVLLDLATLTISGSRIVGRIPLSVFADDGRMAFRVLASKSLGGGALSGVLDTLPASDAPAIRVE